MVEAAIALVAVDIDGAWMWRRLSTLVVEEQ